VKTSTHRKGYGAGWAARPAWDGDRMFVIKLTREERDLIYRNLEYAKKRISDYDQYPSYEFKCQQLEEVEKLMERLKIRNLVESE
jgi:hypothetical protein